MRATIVLAAAACLAALGSAQESRPTSRPAQAVPAQPVEVAPPAPGLVELQLAAPERFLFGMGAHQGKVVVHVNGQAIRFAPASPLIEGAYAEALQALDEARSKLQTATEPEAAFAALDAATKALMDARAALWKLKEKEDEKKAAKPVVQPTTAPKKDN